MPRRAGGVRRKRRTHKIDNDEGEEKVPRSFVIRRGNVPNGIRDLVLELRDMLMPYTATRLRERKSNHLRDYVSIGTQLGISHLWILSATEKGPYLRIGKMAQGPTLTFRIMEYSLCTDIRSMQRRPVTLESSDLEMSPLLIMNNFKDDQKLISETFKHSFPPIDVNTTKLSNLKRVLLIHHDSTSGYIYVRHYLIKLLQSGLTTNVKKITQKKRIPKMSNLQDVSQIMDQDVQHTLYSSDSEAENQFDFDNQVSLTQSVKQMKKGANTSIKLVEVGPRLTLQLVKIQAGLCDGAVLFHRFEAKTKEEEEEIEKRLMERKMLKRKRRDEQEANVKRKEDAKRAKKERRKQAAHARTERLSNEQPGEEDADDEDEEDDEEIVDQGVQESSDSDGDGSPASSPSQ